MYVLKCAGRLVVALAVFVSVLSGGIAARAQVAGGVTPPQVVNITDENGVDLMSGALNLSVAMKVSVGGQGSGLSSSFDLFNNRSDLTGMIVYTQPTGPAGVFIEDVGKYVYTFSWGGQSDKFYVASSSSSIFTQTATPGPATTSTLSCQPTLCTLTRKDGTIITYNHSTVFLNNQNGASGTSPVVAGLVSQVFKPDGEILTYSAQSPTVSAPYVSSSLGWTVNGETQAVNASVDYCSPNQSVGCPNPVQTWPSWTASGQGGSFSFTDPMGNTTTVSQTTYTSAVGAYVAGYATQMIQDVITLPNGVTKTVLIDNVSPSNQSYLYDPNRGRVVSVQIGGSVWKYTNYADQAYQAQSGIMNAIVTCPNGQTKTLVYSPTYNQVLSYSDGLDGFYRYSAKQDNVITQVADADATLASAGGSNYTGGYTQYVYSTDGYLNIQQIMKVPLNAGTNTSLYQTTTATYTPCTAANKLWCNKPVTVTDPDGVVTTYTYSSVHGGVLSVTKAAVNGVSAQTRYTYAAFVPMIKNSAGARVQSMVKVWSNGAWTDSTTPATVYRLTQTSTCMSGSAPSCIGTPDEVVTTLTYDVQSAVSAQNPTQNVLPVTKTVARGDGSLSQTWTTTYDIYGNVVALDGPQPGAVDTVYKFYDANRRVTNTIGVDPDGSGPLARQATITAYNGVGQVTSAQRGTVTGTTLPAFSSFAPLDQTLTTYDGTYGLATLSEYYDYENGAYTPQRLTQTSYNASFKPSCVAQRLNPSVFSGFSGTQSVFASLSASPACALGAQGADGPDRITNYTYDAIGKRVLVTTTGYGTALQRNEQTVSYYYNDLPQTMTDANGNVTSYGLDSFDRPVLTQFPSPTSAGQSNANDYEQISYTGTRVSQVRRRDGSCINFSYDAISRVSTKTAAAVGGICTTSLPITESFSYNNFDQVTSHANNGAAASFGFNSLGWKTSETTGLGQVGYSYDGYGRRSSLSYPGGFNVCYSYNYANWVTAINDCAGNGFAAYGYDAWAHRTSLGRGSSVSTTLSYDTQSRISQIATILPPAVNDAGDNITENFTYTAGNQIKTRGLVTGNPSYDVTPTVSVTTNYAVNGLNELTTAGGSNIAYDARGNLNNDGTASYTYNINNLLTSTSTGAVLNYDSENRLSSIAKNGTTTQFLYDGTDLIAEYDGNGNLLRRYVHGPGTDDLLVWFEGAGEGDARYPTTNWQGSVIGYTAAGGVIKVNPATGSKMINAYDEYGVPQASNIGRFQYTGQTWLSEIGLYYYKARLYSPTLGRFLQTDPIGYKDGMNWYAYVSDDPLNKGDPTGTCDPEHEWCSHQVQNQNSNTEPEPEKTKSPAANAANDNHAQPANDNLPKPSAPLSSIFSTLGSLAAGDLGATLGGALGMWAVPDSTASQEDDEARGVGYHYTTLESAEKIASSGVIIQNNGKVYFSVVPIRASDVNDVLFLGLRPNFGAGVVIFTFPLLHSFHSVPDPSIEHYGMIHFGSIRDGREGVKIVYAGPNQNQ